MNYDTRKKISEALRNRSEDDRQKTLEKIRETKAKKTKVLDFERTHGFNPYEKVQIIKDEKHKNVLFKDYLNIYKDKGWNIIKNMCALHTSE